MKSFIPTLVALILAATVSIAAETREIELMDGSIITGEIVSMEKGVYTVKSAILGTVRIEESKIRSIRKQGSSSVAENAGGQVKSLEDKMMSSDEMMGMVRALQNDPDFQQILKDPEIMKAVQTGNFTALMANPNFMKLLNKQSVQQIKNKLSQ
ncbi:MAG: hypothetical protein ABR903_04335 [Thermodesulfovibrionales bacterium]|jgi:hypothetical protein